MSFTLEKGLEIVKALEVINEGKAFSPEISAATHLIRNLLAVQLATKEEMLLFQRASELRTSIDSIIDKSQGEELAVRISKICAHLNAFFEDSSEQISIIFLKEDEDNPQAENFYIANNTEQTPQKTELPAELLTSSNPNLFTKGKNHFLKLTLNECTLGAIKFKAKKDGAMAPVDLELLKKAAEVIDTFLESQLKQHRHLRIKKTLDRILDRSGTDNKVQDGTSTGFESGLKTSIEYILSKISPSQIVLDLNVFKSAELASEYSISLAIPESKNETQPQKKVTQTTFLQIPIMVPPSSTDQNAKTTQLGSLIINAEKLSANDKEILTMLAEKIASATKNWNDSYRQLKQFGLPPLAALWYKMGILKEKSEQEFTMAFTDIYGFTALSETIQRITETHQIKEDRTMIEFVEAFKTIIAKNNHLFSNHDKVIGDCVVDTFGPPYSTENLDQLGLAPSEKTTMTHAVNAFKSLLITRAKTREIQNYLENLLLKLARKIKPES